MLETVSKQLGLGVKSLQNVYHVSPQVFLKKKIENVKIVKINNNKSQIPCTFHFQINPVRLQINTCAQHHTSAHIKLHTRTKLWLKTQLFSREYSFQHENDDKMSILNEIQKHGNNNSQGCLLKYFLLILTLGVSCSICTICKFLVQLMCIVNYFLQQPQTVSQSILNQNLYKYNSIVLQTTLFTTFIPTLCYVNLYFNYQQNKTLFN